jgi:hypothetical protein
MKEKNTWCPDCIGYFASPHECPTTGDITWTATGNLRGISVFAQGEPTPRHEPHEAIKKTKKVRKQPTMKTTHQNYNYFHEELNRLRRSLVDYLTNRGIKVTSSYYNKIWTILVTAAQVGQDDFLRKVGKKAIDSTLCEVED